MITDITLLDNCMILNCFTVVPQSQYFGLKASELLRGEGSNIGMTVAGNAAQASTSDSSQNLLEWVKQDKRRLLHVVYRVGDLDKTIKYVCFWDIIDVFSEFLIGLKIRSGRLIVGCSGFTQSALEWSSCENVTYQKRNTQMPFLGLVQKIPTLWSNSLTVRYELSDCHSATYVTWLFWKISTYRQFSFKEIWDGAIYDIHRLFKYV